MDVLHVYNGAVSWTIFTVDIAKTYLQLMLFYVRLMQRGIISYLTRFSTKILVIRLANGGRAGCRILNGVKLWFPLNNISLLWLIDTKLGVWVAYNKRQLGIATQVSVIKVKVTVTKNRNSVSAQ